MASSKPSVVSCIRPATRCFKSLNSFSAFCGERWPMTCEIISLLLESKARNRYWPPRNGSFVTLARSLQPTNQYSSSACTDSGCTFLTVESRKRAHLLPARASTFKTVCWCNPVRRETARMPMPSQSIFATWQACLKSTRRLSKGCLSENEVPHFRHSNRCTLKFLLR